MEDIREQMKLSVPTEQVELVDRFFDNATFAGGVVCMEPIPAGGLEGVAIIVSRQDDVLSRAFQVREELSDAEFGQAWEPDDAIPFHFLGDPAKPRALLRCQISATLYRPGPHGGRMADRLVRAMVFDPFQIPASIFAMFQ